VAAIRVGKRFRKDLGDLEILARSIKAIGLLHPIVVDRDGNLIAGLRRLRACKALGWGSIPVTVAEEPHV
jgi:ParB family chromosome partitioning protein